MNEFSEKVKAEIRRRVKELPERDFLAVALDPSRRAALEREAEAQVSRETGIALKEPSNGHR
jgi:hypothetical protein